MPSSKHAIGLHYHAGLASICVVVAIERALIVYNRTLIMHVMYDETLKNIPRLGSIIFMKMRLTFKEIRQCDFYYCASYDTSLDFFDPLETA